MTLENLTSGFVPERIGRPPRTSKRFESGGCPKAQHTQIQIQATLLYATLRFAGGRAGRGAEHRSNPLASSAPTCTNGNNKAGQKRHPRSRKHTSSNPSYTKLTTDAYIKRKLPHASSQMFSDLLICSCKVCRIFCRRSENTSRGRGFSENL